MQQSAVNLSKNISWLDYLTFWIYMRLTLAEKLEIGVFNTINAVSIVRGTWRDLSVSIAWDGTLKPVYHGSVQKTIAEKQEIIDMWEIPLKRENLLGFPEDLRISWENVYASILEVRTIGKSQSAWTPMAVLERVQSAIFMFVKENGSLYLELQRPQ